MNVIPSSDVFEVEYILHVSSVRFFRLEFLNLRKFNFYFPFLRMIVFRENMENTFMLMSPKVKILSVLVTSMARIG